MKEPVACTYDLSQSYDWNYENGPIYSQPVAREEESAAGSFWDTKSAPPWVWPPGLC